MVDESTNDYFEELHGPDAGGSPYDDEPEGKFRFVFDSAIGRAATRSRSYPVIYHYTSADSLIQILSNHCFLATHYRFMNDKKEFVYVLDVVEQCSRSVADGAQLELVNGM